MFKNFDVVYKFTLKNQISPKGYKMTTLITALILFLAPIIIFVIAGNASSDEEEKLEGCGADRIYVVDPLAPKADFNSLNYTGVEGYTDIKYINATSIDEALESISSNGEKTSLVLEFRKKDGTIDSRIILPDNSSIEEDSADNYSEFLQSSGNIVTIMASGISVKDLNAVLTPSEYSVYDIEGYKNGTDLYSDGDKVAEQANAEILPIFNLVLVFVCAFVVYMVIIIYGNSILQNIILEKTSKLMDTMLISVTPESMIFGKMLAVLTSGLIQLFTWLISLILGLFTGIMIYDHMFENISSTLMDFIKNFGELGLFKPVNVIIGILALILGIVMYASISAMAGAVSSTREEGASNQSIFTLLLLASFYIIIFKGIDTTNVMTWIYMVPFTSAMVLPAGICSGVISTSTALIGLLILIACSLIFIILAGKLYKMMSLYKGNPISLFKAIKMLAGQNKKS
ncbi:MAG: ABC transporter permease [Eubacterium sp.]|nr:ABC transporter permease [Eubacterium sp.]